MTLQNFVDKRLPAVSAAWLNQIDELVVGTGSSAPYRQTTAELAAAVTPTNYAYQPGDVRRYGATGDGVTDDTVAIQKAINTGQPVLFYGFGATGANYKANLLTQSKQFQRFIAIGSARLTKNGNGDLLTCTGDDLVFENMDFRGASASFTGHNLVVTGTRPTLVNCASSDAAGRAVKCTRDRVRIIGSCGIFQTADATATGYDIEIGTSGTATLYHVLTDFNSSQNTGGILLIDTGSHVLSGCQIGKLTVQAGTSPAGVNGGMTTNCRILGDITIGFANAVLESNQFGSNCDIVIQAGTSGCRIGDSNSWGNTTTISNLGNANNYICKEVSAGATIQIRYGDDTSLVKMTFDPNTGRFTNASSITVPNNQAFSLTGSGGLVTAALMTLSGADILQIVNNISGKSIQFSQVGTGTMQFIVNAAEAVRIDSTTTAGQTRLMLYDVDNGTLERVTVGAADSGGVGFKLLRIPN